MSVDSKFWFTRPLSDFQDDSELSVANTPPVSSRHDFEFAALHEVFHENSKYFRGSDRGIERRIRAFLENPNLIARGAAGYNDFTGFEHHKLPPCADLKEGIGSLLLKRRSSRRSTLGGSIDLSDLSTILSYSVKVNKEVKIQNGIVKGLRPFPSGGALYPTELYVAVSNVRGVSPSLSYYDARKHSLAIIPNSSPVDIRAAEISDQMCPDAPCTLIITSVIHRSTQKYGTRGYRLALIEAGHLMQNICLTATALGLRSLVSGAFYENEVEQSLGIDGVSEVVLALVHLGSKDEIS